MIYANVYGCIRMHIDCRLGSAIFIKNCPQFSKDIINNRSGCFFMEHSVEMLSPLICMRLKIKA